MSLVPTYDLYGEVAARPHAEFLHCETIASRSRPHDFRIRPHRHDHLFQLLFLSSGSGVAELDGVRGNLPPPCLAVVPAGVVHGYSFSDPVDGLVLTLYQRRIEAILHAIPAATRNLAAPLIVPLSDHPEAARVIACSLASVADEFGGHAAGRVGMMGAHLAIACLVACRVRSASAQNPGQASPRGVGHVSRFRAMIEREFRARPPIEACAARLGVTEVHLRRLCQAHLGMTPLGVLNRRVALEAQRLLAFGALEVKEIAAATGFADHAYFSRFFRRETGETPTAFRARQQTTAGSSSLVAPRHSADRLRATGRRDA